MNFYRSARGPVRLALLLIILLTLIALSSHYWLPHDPYAIDLAARLRAPDGQHWLGTDHLGRDILSRLLAATRVSLGSVLACLLLVLALGLIIGGSAGLLGGRIDQASMRLADMFMTFPTSILSFFMVGVLGTGLTNVIIAIALSHWAWYARMVRSLVITLRQREYILAARLSGAGYLRIFVDHLSGAVIPSLLVLATLDIGHMMLHVAGMSFLGLGVAAPTAEWGVMINDARQYIWTQPLQMFWPGLALFLSVMAFNLVGDALRDHLDPHLVTEHAH
ncbi:nickel ABC transporter permease subunit NikC [Edwardsiella piscicida]|uniref:nickel ABC transporter permease subunit NikC n=1 Tax=Edwardsiella piscicida TaxID=1263550 RepID=UPI0002C0FBB0|nr:nickel ABC transporter permease subunit NikC [Edwardsiella piscicida]AGH73423.1 nickel transporter permease NikC [Edwardsiella piscicida C07-087]EKS7779107.1 nickel ABC transporter permease subunit NikC [Edwardsiella piscicida]EKS7782527.1 nickel ABC transporter permease subunit NikC [Edwardsiella piscicida]EKS7811888.1 nickel ABC transporter permease subunit NikC [Edwardsiella piscicida]UCQ22336.1 nickel ABC transporter permease subunit NikC [Edwardsiella piscicida]